MQGLTIYSTVSQARPNLRAEPHRLEMISARGKLSYRGRLSSLIDKALRVNWVWPARLFTARLACPPT